MMLSFTNPINTSIYSGILSFIVLFLLLLAYKPKSVQKVNKNGDKSISWGHIILIPVIIGLSVS